MLNKMIKSITIMSTVVTLGLGMIGCQSTEEKENEKLIPAAKHELYEIGKNDVLEYLDTHEEGISVEDILNMTYDNSHNEEGDYTGFGIENVPRNIDDDNLDDDKEYIRGVASQIEFDDDSINVEYIHDLYEERMSEYGIVDIDTIECWEANQITEDELKPLLDSIMAPIFGVNLNQFYYTYEVDGSTYRVDVRHITNDRIIKQVILNKYTHDYKIYDKLYSYNK